MGFNDRDRQKSEPLTILDLGTEFSKKPAPLKVLVSDDDPPSRMLLRASLTQWGYEVIEANDGEEAWQILQQPEAPRLLILDWLMPKLDGINLCMKIRKELVESSSYYIILLSQISGNANIKIAIDGGANEFLSKPFDYLELRSRILSAARLVQYELQLSEENTQLKKNLSRYNELALSIATIAKKMEEISKNNSSLDKDQLQKIQELQALIDYALKLLKSRS